jgi:hypothetical protein
METKYLEQQMALHTVNTTCNSSTRYVHCGERGYNFLSQVCNSEQCLANMAPA